MANSKNLREFFSLVSKNIELGEDFDLETIPEVELPDNFSDEFHAQYLTPLSAKNDKDIRNHFRGQYLNSVDSRLKASFLANGGDEDMFNELKSQEPDSMKLIDLITGKVSELKSTGNAPSDNKEFEKYKAETAREIQEYKDSAIGFDAKLNKTLSDNNTEWSNKMKSEKITSYLNSKTFNNGMEKADAIYLIKRKIEDSDYILKLDENGNQKVMDKANPEMAAIIEGADVSWSQVLDKYSDPYSQKNDQVQTTTKREVTVPASTTSNSDGFYIPGHKNYGKQQ